MRNGVTLILAGSLGAVGLALVSCDDKKDDRTVSDKVEKAVEKSGEKVGNAVEKTGEAIQRGAEKAAPAVGDAAEKTADAAKRDRGSMDLQVALPELRLDPRHAASDTAAPPAAQPPPAHPWADYSTTTHPAVPTKVGTASSSAPRRPHPPRRTTSCFASYVCTTDKGLRRSSSSAKASVSTRPSMSRATGSPAA